MVKVDTSYIDWAKKKAKAIDVFGTRLNTGRIWIHEKWGYRYIRWRPDHWWADTKTLGGMVFCSDHKTIEIGVYDDTQLEALKDRAGAIEKTTKLKVLITVGEKDY